MKTAIINKSSLKIESVYDGDTNQGGYGGPWADSELFVHLSYDESVNGGFISAQDDGQGNITLIENSELIRNSKLSTLRTLRDGRLSVVDNEIKKHEDSDPTATSTLVGWKTVRIALRSITDNFKYANDANKGKATLDVYDFQLSDFDQWPADPA